MQTVPTFASTRCRKVSSLSTLPLTRRVDPNATSVLVRQLQLVGRAPEQFVVLRVGAGPTGLDVVDPEVVELLGDAQLVLDGERDALELRPIPQRRVVDLDLSCFRLAERLAGARDLSGAVRGELAARPPGRSARRTCSLRFSDNFTPVFVLVDLAADGFGVFLGDRAGHRPGARDGTVVDASSPR